MACRDLQIALHILTFQEDPGPSSEIKTLGCMALQEVQAKVIEVSGALASIGINARDRAAVFSVNCPEWMLVLQVNPITSLLCESIHACACAPCFAHIAT